MKKTSGQLLLILNLSMAIMAISSKSVYADISCARSETRTPVDLAAPGGSMEHFRVQNQDGLGTCYANALTAMLEATLPNNPALSFQQVSILHGMNHKARDPATNRTDAIFESTNARTNETSIKSFNEGGDVCRSYDFVKARGSLCLREDVPVENIPAGRDQKTVFHTLGQLYDQITEQTAPLANRAQRQDWQRRLRQSLSQVRSAAQLGASMTCQYPMSDPPLHSIKKIMQDYCIKKFRVAEEKSLYALISSAVAESSSGRTRTHNQQAAERERAESQAATTEYEKIGTIERDGIGNEVKCNLNPNFESAMVEHYWRLLEANPSNPRAAIDSLLTQTGISADALGTPAPVTNARLARMLRKDIMTATPERCQTALTWIQMSDENFLRDRLAPQFQCLSNNLSSSFGILDMTNRYRLPMQEALDALTSLDPNLHDFTMGIIGPGCLSDAVSIPSQLRCNKTTFPIQLRREVPKSEWNDVYGPNFNSRGMRLLNHNLGIMRNKVESALRTGRPVGIDVCTSFHKDPLASSTYGRDCSATGPHGYHAMAIVGHRCVNGSLEYLIQNSWGPGCGFTRSMESDWVNPDLQVRVEHYDCIEGRGAFWVGEESLMRNMRAAITLEGPNN